jgi:hypothetical protein
LTPLGTPLISLAPPLGAAVRHPGFGGARCVLNLSTTVGAASRNIRDQLLLFTSALWLHTS